MHLRMIEPEPFLRPGETREQRKLRREKELEGIDQLDARSAEYVDCAAPSGICRFFIGDRIMWRTPFGIGDIAIAATIDNIRVWSRSLQPVTLGLTVEPSEPLRRAYEAIKATAGYDTWPKTPDGFTGVGGRILITGDAFWRGAHGGNIGLASDVDKDELARIPDWTNVLAFRAHPCA